VQAIYVPADDYTDPAPATTFAHLDATTNLSRAIAELGHLSAVDPLASTVAHSRSARHRRRALHRRAPGEAGAAALQGPAGHHRDPRYRRTVEDDKLTVTRARKIQRFLSQPFFVAEQFTGFQGKYVQIADTIRGFKEIVDGQHDALPEQAFYMVGTIEEASRGGPHAQHTRSPRLEIVTPEKPHRQREWTRCSCGRWAPRRAAPPRADAGALSRRAVGTARQDARIVSTVGVPKSCPTAWSDLVAARPERSRWAGASREDASMKSGSPL
jgi:hypothetical protein